MHEAPYGSWSSPISAADLAGNSVRFFDIVGDGAYVYNVEMRPNEGGRYVIVQYDAAGNKKDILPAPYSACTKVHEYGGRSFTVWGGTVYFVNLDDQNLYSFKVGEAPKQITTDSVRFAELTMTLDGLLAVAERHLPDREAQNFLALIDPETGALTELETGYDFYAFPSIHQISLNHCKIAWLCWNHPNMPWDDNELWVAEIRNKKIINKRRIRNESDHQSFYQPQWDINGNLVFIADKTNWWNPYLWNATTDTVIPLLQQEADFAHGLWILGSSVMAQLDNFFYFTYMDPDGAKIVAVDVNNLPSKYVMSLPFTKIDDLCIHNGCLYFNGASPTQASSLIKQRLMQHDIHGEVKILAESSHIKVDPNYLSIGEPIEFPTASRQGIAHAYFYEPKNPDFCAPAGSKPPLMVVIHGGPTSATCNALSLEKQYWTSRGFAVADVNYGGSTGYGRAYRKALQRDSEHEAGYWGDVDIKDCVACVEYLIAKGLVDPKKVVIRGGSAGGYTTYAALAFTQIFCAGTSFYGVSDIYLLAKETHKFESRYMDQLVGELPKFKEVYDQRSPLQNVDKIKAPMLILQGDQDKIVLPNQSEMMVAALQRNGVPVEYKLYSGERHGFRQASTIIDARERELAFYRAVFERLDLDAKKSSAARASPSLVA